jgi:hypothetical protein
VVGKKILFPGTGQVGHAQRFKEVLNKLILTTTTSSHQQVSPVDFACEISYQACQNFAHTSSPNNQFGALVGYVVGKTFALAEFSIMGFQPELKSADCWFASMGSGQMIVDPFLALLKATLFSSGQPLLNEGIFATVWALQHAIKLNPGGINDPMQIGTICMDPSNKYLEAKMLTDEELSEHQQNVVEMTRYIGNYRDVISGAKSGKEMTTSPPPVLSAKKQ